MRKIHLTVAVILSAAVLAGTFSACASNSAKKETSTTKASETQRTTETKEISEIKISNLESTEKLKVGGTKLGIFSIIPKGDVDLNNIEVISSDPTVVSIDYKAKKLDTGLDDAACSFYLKGESSGEAIIHVQTKGATIKSNEVKVTVIEDLPDSSNTESTELSSSSFDISKVKTTLKKAEEDHLLKKVPRASIYTTISKSDYEKMSDSDIELISRKVVTSYCMSHKVCALGSNLYVEEDIDEFGRIELTLPISITTYYPYGDISRASEVTAGDYTNFEMNVRLENGFRDAYFKNADN